MSQLKIVAVSILFLSLPLLAGPQSQAAISEQSAAKRHDDADHLSEA